MILGKKAREHDEVGQHHKDCPDDGNFLGLVQNDDGSINRSVVEMTAATKKAITPWGCQGGKFSPAKTCPQVNKTSQHVVTIVQEMSELVGIKMMLVCPAPPPGTDGDDVATGSICPGRPCHGPTT